MADEKNDQIPTTKKAEKKAEKEAEAEEKLESEPSKEEAGESPDEASQVAAQVEEASGTEEETPAEVEAINTDNQTAQEATRAEAVEEKPQDKSQEKQSGESGEAPTKAEPTGKFKELIKEIEGLTTLELAELVRALEERFGVSASAPMTAAAPATGGAAVPEEEKKANFTVVLADSGSQKIAVIKALREINQELGLKEAKDIADAPPKEILKDAPKEKADEAKKKLEAAGAKVELK